MLNKPAYRNAKIIVAGDNFGCGSSREHAPWALKDFGISCVISTSFADIFYNNCFQNGILPVVVSPEDLEKLMDDASRGANATITVDLAAQEIRGPDGGVVHFEIDAFKKHCMLNGLDGVGLTHREGGGDRCLREPEPGRAALGLTQMGAVIEFLLVGRSPLGSAVRAVVIAVLLVMFWTLFIVDRWQLCAVSLITALAVVIAAHLFSKRDNPLRDPGV